MERLLQLLQLSHFQYQILSIDEIRQIITDLVDRDVDFSKIDIENLCCIFYNLTQKIDKNVLFGDEFVAMIRKIVDHFMNRDISREVGLLLESIFKSLSRENCDTLVDDSLVQFVVKFMKWKKGGAVIARKYCVIAMRISVVCPNLIPAFIEHIDIAQVKKLVGNNENDRETMFAIYNWISHISSHTSGIEFILKEPNYFTKILCELIKNTTLQIFFQKAVMALENLLRLENQIVQEVARSELIGCIPNMTKVYFPPDLKERWDRVQKMF
jgi:hypothetical protein